MAHSLTHRHLRSSRSSLCFHLILAIMTDLFKGLRSPGVTSIRQRIAHEAFQRHDIKGIPCRLILSYSSVIGISSSPLSLRSRSTTHSVSRATSSRPPPAPSLSSVPFPALCLYGPFSALCGATCLPIYRFSHAQGEALFLFGGVDAAIPRTEFA